MTRLRVLTLLPGQRGGDMCLRMGTILLVALIAVGCETQSPPQSTASPSPWFRGSQAVDADVVETLPAPQHCEGASAFLVLGWPLGRAEPSIDRARWYVRDPADFLKSYLMAEFAINVTPPPDARYTTYHNATFELWLAPSDQDLVVYMKTGGGFERWPRSKQALLCV